MADGRLSASPARHYRGFFFQAEDGIRDYKVTGVQTCALPILDRSWRRAAVRRLAWERRPDGTYLDLCAGTLDLAATLARAPGFRGTVLGADFVLPMPARGKDKAPRTRPVGADALALPFVDARFDGAMVAFGVRNLADLDAGLRETHRVLRPGARFVVLEFTTPRFAPLRALYLFYFRRVLPAIGRAVSKHRD